MENQATIGIREGLSAHPTRMIIGLPERFAEDASGPPH
jgi:hypothetical protein